MRFSVRVRVRLRTRVGLTLRVHGDVSRVYAMAARSEAAEVSRDA